MHFRATNPCPYRNDANLVCDISETIGLHILPEEFAAVDPAKPRQIWQMIGDTLRISYRLGCGSDTCTVSFKTTDSIWA
jgi:hypothetical protein